MRSMKAPAFALLVMLAVSPSASHAGFADSLRSIRDTVNQITYTSSDVKTMSSEVGGFMGIDKSVQTSSGTTIAAGQVLMTKINNVSLYQTANKAGTVLQKLPKGSEVVFSGNVNNGLYSVTTEFGDGWVDANLLQ